MKISIFVMAMLFVVGFTACKNDVKHNDADNNPSQMISGASQKTWHATRETDAEGDKDKITRDEQKETITFYSNGKVSMSSPMETREGTWSYDGTMLSWQYEGASVSENFTVKELTDNTMKITAGDGSEMTLKAD
ncbi:MAG: lipocalin family protein [Chitinophagaceae bacterium]|nr:lipocalin family protein [Chitinophagaceae bacterium]